MIGPEEFSEEAQAELDRSVEVFRTVISSQAKLLAELDQHDIVSKRHVTKAWYDLFHLPWWKRWFGRRP